MQRFSCLSLSLLVAALLPALAQNQVGPQTTVDAVPSGACFFEGQCVTVADTGADGGKQYCCESLTWAFSPQADTSAELAAEISDEVGTDKVVFSDTAVMDAPFTVRDDAPATALYVDTDGMLVLNQATPVVARLNIKGGESVTPVAPDAFSYGTPFIWFEADDITGGVDEGECGAPGCTLIETGTSTNSTFSDGKRTGSWMPNFKEAEVNGHDAIQVGSGGIDAAMQGGVSYTYPGTEYVISDSFTVVAVYHPGGNTNSSLIMTGKGQGQTGSSYVSMPGSNASANCIFQDYDGDAETTASANNVGDVWKIGFIRRNGPASIDCWATTSTGLPASYGSVSETGDALFQTLMELHNPGYAPPGTMMAELIIYKEYLTDAQRDQLYQHLAVKYGLTTIPDGAGAAGSGGEEYIAIYDQDDVRVLSMDGLGRVGIGSTDIDPVNARLELRDTTTQLRIGYSEFQYCDLIAESDGDMDIDCPGGQVTLSGTPIVAHPTTSAGVRALLSDETGTGSMVFASAPDLVGPVDVTGGVVATGNLSGVDGTFTGDVTVTGDVTGDAAIFTGGETLIGLGRGDQGIQSSVWDIAGTRNQLHGYGYYPGGTIDCTALTTGADLDFTAGSCPSAFGPEPQWVQTTTSATTESAGIQVGTGIGALPGTRVWTSGSSWFTSMRFRGGSYDVPGSIQVWAKYDNTAVDTDGCGVGADNCTWTQILSVTGNTESWVAAKLDTSSSDPVPIVGGFRWYAIRWIFDDWSGTGSAYVADLTLSHTSEVPFSSALQRYDDSDRFPMLDEINWADEDGSLYGINWDTSNDEFDFDGDINAAGEILGTTLNVPGFALTGAIDHAALVGTGAAAAGWTNAIPDCHTENHLTFTQAGNTWACESDTGGVEVNDLETTDPTAILDHEIYQGDGAGSGTFRAVPDCHTDNMLTYTQSTDTWGCDADDGAGGGAPIGVQYVVGASDATLTAEKILTDGQGIDTVLSGGDAGAATIDLAYTDTLAADPAFDAEECVFTTDGTGGGGILCEGNVGGNANEQLYVFPAQDNADTEQVIAVSDSVTGCIYDDTNDNWTPVIANAGVLECLSPKADLGAIAGVVPFVDQSATDAFTFEPTFQASASGILIKDSGLADYAEWGKCSGTDCGAEVRGNAAGDGFFWDVQSGEFTLQTCSDAGFFCSDAQARITLTPGSTGDGPILLEGTVDIGTLTTDPEDLNVWGSAHVQGDFNVDGDFTCSTGANCLIASSATGAVSAWNLDASNASHTGDVLEVSDESVWKWRINSANNMQGYDGQRWFNANGLDESSYNSSWGQLTLVDSITGTPTGSQTAVNIRNQAKMQMSTGASGSFHGARFNVAFQPTGNDVTGVSFSGAYYDTNDESSGTGHTIANLTVQDNNINFLGTGTTTTTNATGIGLATSYAGTNKTISAIRMVWLKTPTAPGSGTTVTNQIGMQIDNLGGYGSTDAILIGSQTADAATEANLRFAGGAWNTGHVQLGAAHVWSDGSTLYGKASAPTGATDGTDLLAGITSAGVTYENLSANSDIGFGASQVPQGSLTAPLASPALTGDPTAPTASTGDSDTSIATTDFVDRRTQQECKTIESLVAADDDVLMWIPRVNITVTAVSCQSDAAATVVLEDYGGTSIETIVCETDGAVAWDSSMSGTATLSAGEVMRMDTTSESTPTWTMVCWTYTND